MQTNFNYNNQNPQFGMFRRPKGLTKKIFIGYINPNSEKLIERGFNQFEKEALKARHFDVEFNPCNWSMNIINKTSGEIVERIGYLGKQLGFDIEGEINYPGKKLFAKMFNPKRFLPKNVYLAGQKVKGLEKQVMKQEKSRENFFA